MTTGKRLAAAAMLPGILLALWLAAGAAMLWATLDAPAGAAVGAALVPFITTHWALVFGWWLVGAGFGAWVVLRTNRLLVRPLSQMAYATRRLRSETAPALVPPAFPPLRRLANAVNDLAAERDALRSDMAGLVEEASRRAAEDRDRLAALMSELEEGVIVCSAEGRILLYNDRALTLFDATRPQRNGVDGTGPIGLGRSIHAAIEPAVLAHARRDVGRRLARGETRPSARFVLAANGRLLQASLAPVHSETASETGFVLLTEDITEVQAAKARREGHLLELIETSRASLASMQAALDMLDLSDLAAPERTEFEGVVRAEVSAMANRLAEVARDTGRDPLGHWPMQDILGADLVEAVAHRVEEVTGKAIRHASDREELWLRADGFGLVEALAALAARLAGASSPLILRLAPAGEWAHLDLAWETGDGDPARMATGWLDAPLGGDGTPSPRDLAERQGGSVWLALDRETGLSYVRFMLACASSEPSPPPRPARPVCYDFDLLVSEAGSALDDCPLDRLTCTVLDCETTGLDPVGGDEIIQIGAVRILNGRLVPGEALDQLVDPERSIPQASIQFHGIAPETLRGAPKIAEVLPVLHAFASDTVLVGHNVAFDLRFLRLKEQEAGVRFDQPVLDTLLLASLVEPDADSHALEAIAARLGVPVVARHSAAGDALTTARVFLGLLPLLRDHGIASLGAARAASLRSPFARLRY